MKPHPAPPEAIEALLQAFDTLYRYASDGCSLAETHPYHRPNRARVVLETWLNEQSTTLQADRLASEQEREKWKAMYHSFGEDAAAASEVAVNAIEELRAGTPAGHRDDRRLAILCAA